MRFEDRLQQWRATRTGTPRASTSMKLPGAPATRRIAPPDLGDEPTNASRWTSPDLQRAILALLALAPRHKWELRDLIHVNEARIIKELKALRHAGQVKVVGRRLIERRWALASWQTPEDPTSVKSQAPRPRHRFPRPLLERYADLLR